MEQTREEIRKSLTNLIINEGQRSEENLLSKEKFEKEYKFNKKIKGVLIDLIYAFNEKNNDSVLGLHAMNVKNIPIRNYMEINYNGKIRYNLYNGVWGLRVPKEFKGDPEKLFLKFGGYILEFLKNPEGFQN